jgi:phosphate transporter
LPRYDSLKSAIYRLEKDAVFNTRQRDYRDVESAALLASQEDDQSDRDKLFSRLIDEELSKVVNFYKEKERELLAEVDNLAHEMERIETEPLYAMTDDAIFEDEEDEDEDEDDDDSVASEPHSARRRSSFLDRRPGRDSSRKRRPSKPVPSRERANSTGTRDTDLLGPDESPAAASGNSDHAGPASEHRKHGAESSSGQRRAKQRRFSFSDASWAGPSSYLSDTCIALKLRLQGLFRDLSQLRQFASLNYTGFRKILKK